MKAIVLIVLATLFAGCIKAEPIIYVYIEDPEGRQVFLDSVRQSGREFEVEADGTIAVHAADMDDLRSVTPAYETWKAEKVRQLNQPENQEFDATTTRPVAPDR
jgi:hypothetical protein